MTPATRAVPAVLIFLASMGCSRGEGPPGATFSEAGGAPAGVDAASSLGDAAPAASTPRSWTGTYKATAGGLYVPDGWKVRWHPDDATSGMGEGALTLRVDEATGTVGGTLEGPLGPARVDGYAVDGGVSGTITRRDPHDHGFAGVLTGRAIGGKIEGTLNVSPATGGAVRVGTFVVSPGGTVPEP